MTLNVENIVFSIICSTNFFVRLTVFAEKQFVYRFWIEKNAKEGVQNFLF